MQAVKDPMKSKGARLTTEISLPGRFLVYVPNGEGSGVSRRLEDAERTRLKEIVKNLDPKGGGIIVRTAAEGASAEDIERDLVFLQRLWKTIQTKAKNATAPTLVYEEAELPLRIVRDLFAGDFVGAQIDDDRTHRRIVSYLKKTSPHMVERVHRYRDKAPLFEASGVDAEIRSTLERRVDLPSGGYLVFDYAEAFTVIDVNTGRFVGSRGKSAQGRLEDTIVKNNLEAVNEVVRQLRLRDIGGIIVIDFIDMANPKNRETVEEALRSELERDRTKTYVVEISPLGLVEMTRQNVTDGPREILTNRCPVCSGDGVVVSDATHALEVERKLRAIAKGSRVQAFEVAVHPRVLALLAGPGGARLEELEAAARRRFFLAPAAGNGHVHLDHFEVVRQGKLETLRPATPVADGDEVELKLVEVGLHDPTAGVGQGRRRLRDRRRGRVEARRQEGHGDDRTGARRDGLRDTRRRSGRRGVADHLRGRGGEADASLAEQEGASGVDRARGGAAGRGGDGRPRRERRPRTRVRAERRRPTEEEADAARHARRPGSQEAGGRGGSAIARTRRTDGRPAGPRIHVPPADLETTAAEAVAEPSADAGEADAAETAADATAEAATTSTARPRRSARAAAHAAVESARSRQRTAWRKRRPLRSPPRPSQLRRARRSRACRGRWSARVRSDVGVDRGLRRFPRGRSPLSCAGFRGPPGPRR